MNMTATRFATQAIRSGRRSMLRLGAVALLAMAANGVAQAQAWPQRPIHFVVPFGAGSGTDIVARLVGQKLAEAVGQPVIVDNKVGASGAIGADFAARSAPDGYTVFIATQTTQSSNPGMFRKLPYDPLKSFESVSLLGSIPLIVVVNPAVPANNIQELVAYARTNPGKLTIGYGTGAAQVTAELFKTLSKTDVLLVPYKSNPLALTAVVAGEVQMMVTDPGPSLPLIASGKAKALAVTTAKRSAVAPQLPTMGESGMSGYELSAWYAALLPAGTPKDIVTRLQGEIARIMAMPDVREKLNRAGIEAASSTPQQLQQFMESELVKWTGHIKNAGMIPE